MAIEIIGAQAVMQKLSALGQQAQQAAQMVVARTGESAAAYARQRAPMGGSSGTSAHLAQSIHCEVKGTTASVGTAAPHAQYVEFGTGWPIGHQVYTTVKRKNGTQYTVKGWIAPINGNLRVVQGMPPRPYMRPAMEYAQRLLPNQARQIMGSVIK